MNHALLCLIPVFSQQGQEPLYIKDARAREFGHKVMDAFEEHFKPNKQVVKYYYQSHIGREILIQIDEHSSPDSKVILEVLTRLKSRFGVKRFIVQFGRLWEEESPTTAVLGSNAPVKAFSLRFEKHGESIL